MRQGEPKKHCPDCNTGSCFYKFLLDGTLRHFCACRRTYWDWDAPPSSEELLSNLSDNIKEAEGTEMNWRKGWEELVERGTKDVGMLYSDKMDHVIASAADYINSLEKENAKWKGLLHDYKDQEKHIAELEEIIESRLCTDHAHAHGLFSYEEGDKTTPKGGGCVVCIGMKVDAENIRLHEAVEWAKGYLLVKDREAFKEFKRRAGMEEG